ncbi:MAG: hypothetical protein LC124_00195 [Ignavibacteriales bacterium]|nr:hypothetical protein [Ignavibacterium sp.]MCZ2267256.1 hypothetical protein [Ignavibacteriales bacterium]HMN16369.1 hypothetical protein [Ignavibacteriaceae bacterium]
MKSKSILMMLLVVIICLTNTSEAQQVNRIFEQIGGGSGQPANVNESNDNTVFYIAGAAIVAGIVIYAILSDKKSGKAKEDTTAVLNDEELINKHLSFNEMIQNYQTAIPISISAGIQNDIVRIEEKRYFLGLSYNF